MRMMGLALHVLSRQNVPLPQRLDKIRALCSNGRAVLALEGIAFALVDYPSCMNDEDIRTLCRFFVDEDGVGISAQLLLEWSQPVETSWPEKACVQETLKAIVEAER